MADPYFWARREDQSTIKDITTFASSSASQIDNDGPPQHTVAGFRSGKYDVYVSAGLNGEKQGPVPHTRVARIRSQRPDTPSPDREVTLEYIDDSDAIETDGGNRYTPYEIRDGDPASEGQTVRVTEILARQSQFGKFDNLGVPSPRIVENGSVITTSAGRPAVGFADGEAIGGGINEVSTFLIVCEITSSCDISTQSIGFGDPLAGGNDVIATSSHIKITNSSDTVLKRPYPQGKRIGVVVATDTNSNDVALAVNGSDVEDPSGSTGARVGFAVGGNNASGLKLLGGLAYFDTFLGKSKREQLSGIYA